MKKILPAVLTALVFLLTAAAACASYKAIPVYDLPMSVCRADGVGFSLTSFQNSRSDRYFFLPAYMDGQLLTLTLQEGTELEIDGVRYANGDAARMTGGTTAQLITGRGTVPVYILSSTLPCLHLTLEEGGLDRIAEDKGHKEPAELLALSPEGVTLWSGALKNMKGHGNATFVFKKKSYQIHFEEKTGLLGLTARKKFILLANQHENSLLRNRITFDLARAAGLRYTPECAPVDLYANGEYLGSYLLCSKIGVGSGGVDITDAEELTEAANGNPEQLPKACGTRKAKAGTFKGIAWEQEPEDVTGGFLFSLEYASRYKDTTSGVVTRLRGQTIAVKSPENMTAGQGQYLLELLDSLERAIYDRNGMDTRTGRHYTEIISLDSFARKYLIEEISRNYDSNNSSMYFYKDSDSIDPLIYAGPVWDYDSAWGGYSGTGKTDVDPVGLFAAAKMKGHQWWPALYAQPEFLERVKTLWWTEFRPLMEVLVGDAEPWEGCGVTPIPVLAQEMDASAQMNFKRWLILNSQDHWLKTGATYAANIDYLTDWIRQRIAFLDKKWQINQK